MSFKTIFEEIFGFALATGESLTPVFVHNPKSQQIVQVLTPDVNALFQLLTTAAQSPTTASQTSST